MNPDHRENLKHASLVAHQMKAPLGTLQTIMRTLLGGFAGELTEQQKTILQSADSKCSEAMDTVKTLLALSEINAERRGKHTSDLVAVTNQSCDRFRLAASGKNIEFQFDSETSESYVNADASTLLEAVSALIDNAVKYTPDGGRIAVMLDIDERSSETRLSVADSGIGIPDEERDQLFEPFFRASNARRLIPNGTGLGLPFSKAVFEAAGGTLSAGRSELGGALFTATVPLARKPAGRENQEPSFRVVVIGGVAAGPKIAAKIMRLKPDAHVTIIEKGRVLSYAGCGLPYYISGLVKNQNDLVSTPEGIVRGPEFFEKVKNVHVLNRTEAIAIDRANRCVIARDLITGEEKKLPYDKLAITTGALPIVPSWPGVHLLNILTLHGLEHAESIRALLSETRAKDVTIVGGGLIGVEMTESLVSAGCRVTLVEMLPQVLPALIDAEMAELVRREFESKGVRVLLNTRVTGFEGNGKVQNVMTSAGAIPTDMVIIGVGVRPNVALATAAGIEIGRTGAIKTDSQMRTSDPDIYAAGDCVECTDLVTGTPTYVPLGSTANKQGRVAAVNICGGNDTFSGITSTTVCKVFELTVARAGLTERTARSLGYNVITTLTPGLDRAHFMPHAAMIIIKLIGDSATRKLLGIQVVGPGEAAKRVDVAITAITGGLTIDAIANLDLCYAPSYSDALDNLHTACNVLRNKIDGHMSSLTAAEVRKKLDDGEEFLLLDVRTHAEFDEARIEGSKHIPLGSLRGRLKELRHYKEIIIFSRVSLSAYEATVILKANGFSNVKVMEGGILLWPYGTSR